MPYTYIMSENGGEKSERDYQSGEMKSFAQIALLFQHLIRIFECLTRPQPLCIVGHQQHHHDDLTNAPKNRI